MFRRYDDGWRLVNVSTIANPNEPASLTAKERAADEQDTRKAAEESARKQAQRNAEIARLSNLVKESQTPTQEIANFTFRGIENIRDYGDGEVVTTVKISDVGVWWETKKPAGVIYNNPTCFSAELRDRACYTTSFIWFGDIGKYSDGTSIYHGTSVGPMGNHLTDRFSLYFAFYISGNAPGVTPGVSSGVSYNPSLGYSFLETSSKEDVSKAYESISPALEHWRDKYKEVVELLNNNRLDDGRIVFTKDGPRESRTYHNDLIGWDKVILPSNP
jgi:hypothetical protein